MTVNMHPSCGIELEERLNRAAPGTGKIVSLMSGTKRSGCTDRTWKKSAPEPSSHRMSFAIPLSVI
jgi:hypothetical protein